MSNNNDLSEYLRYKGILKGSYWYVYDLKTGKCIDLIKANKCEIT